MTELKPYPFCGSRDLKHYISNAGHRGYRGVIVCNSCGVRLEAYSESYLTLVNAGYANDEANEYQKADAREKVAMKWNTRAERTCRVTVGPTASGPGWQTDDISSWCSECHGTLNRDVYTGRYPSHCPHCGAKVVRETTS